MTAVCDCRMYVVVVHCVPCPQAKKSKSLAPELRKKVDALFASYEDLTPKAAVKPAALFAGVGSYTVLPQ